MPLVGPEDKSDFEESYRESDDENGEPTDAMYFSILHCAVVK